MAIQVALYHKTDYIYDRKIQLGPQVIRLRPAPHCRTPILSYNQTVSPEDHWINWQQDPFSNYLSRLNFQEKTDHFSIVVDLVAEMVTINPFDFFLEEYAREYPFKYSSEVKKDLGPFLQKTHVGSKFTTYLSRISRQKENTIDFLVRVNQDLQKAIRYNIRMEPNVQACEETLTKQSGSCRDSAWLLVNILRHLGLASRFVSGYLIQLAADVKSLEGPSGPEQDFTDLHAWVEVFLPGAGWVGLDPTSGLLAGEGHIPLACTPFPKSAAPVTGGLEMCEVDFSHTMHVTRIHEDPRSTKPYPEEIWTKIHDLGFRVDKEIEKEKISLTMGGEPTFVSATDMDADEWNTAAVGPTKKIKAMELLQRLRGKWTQGSLLHIGQGKWYPGESLPRWALGCYWRKDGKALWQDPSLLADDTLDYKFGPAQAKTLMQSVTRVLGVDEQYIIPAYEDVFYWLLKEQRLPANVTPEDSRLKDPEERARMARVFEQGIGAVTGFVLPIKKGSWKSCLWELRAGNLFLTPGDSPMGLRLPLDSLPWISPKQYPHVVEEDPMGIDGPFPDPLTSGPDKERLRRAEEAKQGQFHIPGQPETETRDDIVSQSLWPASHAVYNSDGTEPVIRTALCIQPRQGRLYVFMPPMASAADYFELIAAVEQAAGTTGFPVIIEGYTPPFDHRINVLNITPDPGVIEVNIHPATDWGQMVDVTCDLYEEARQSGLGTEKFMLDGRHSGTGGGNHIVMGGPSPAQSPWLARPDLLRSFLTFWNNHPSLSFLFSGLFMGPTSQSPRIDEARHDTLDELDIAFAELDKQTSSYQSNFMPGSDIGLPCPPWLVDRLFRHLLTDLTGNTHRAEFCIDKLYSPDSASGRLGLLEFRSFEMPPHARMSLAQQLLLRIFMLKFWKTPYKEKLVRWGTTLHDKFMLPFYVWQDFCDLLDILRREGYDLTPGCFHPHFEFRFPFIGKVCHAGVEIELRTAIEPWHVLGEEPGGGGTARYVDSSLERIQIKVSGMTDNRYQVLCNGRPVPLHPTDVKTQSVAGIRYRAWQPPSCLHPTIGVHTPLIFDLVDTWNLRSVGGCTYHASHPGGRNYDTFPINSLEAEGRRISRFRDIGHTPGPMEQIPNEPLNPRFPYTLDLRTRP